ncbi:MAG: TIGR02186 family protein [Pseudomonadota bacterium]
MRCLAVLFLLMASPVWAEDIVAGLSQDEISITANFDGSEILVFGAVSREAPAPEGPLGIIITVAGPDDVVLVRRKDRRFGIWVNTDTAEIDAAPAFYAVATNTPLNEILSATEDLRHSISIGRAIRAVDTRVDDQAAYTRALVRIRSAAGLYQLLEGAVELREETLFDTRIRLPANLVEGDYLTRIYLTRGRDVVAFHETSIAVRKVGLERMIYRLAHDRPLVYGIVALTIAIIAGWGASAAFQLLRR